MKKKLLIVAVLMIIGTLLFGQRMSAQTNDSVDSEIAALRADLKSGKTEIIKEAMQLNPGEADAFWPVYKQYDQEVSKVNDELVTLIKTYAEKFGSINDADARDLTLRAFAVQAKKIELKKKYFPMFSKATSALTAAKFFQVDYRLELLFNLKLASELPALLVQPAPTATGTGN